ncbi:hypothetical protein AC45_5200 [Escherichia coli 2-210-07_S3_C3]|nr:hypothetical protein EC3431_2049 [Escherichia coli 3431]KDX17215.1 hypothetical protein AC45_5200 [Escherichia coli 2-210-07_S3_C3]
MTAMNTPKKRAFIYPNINIKTSTFSIYLAVKGDAANLLI